VYRPEPGIWYCIGAAWTIAAPDASAGAGLPVTQRVVPRRGLRWLPAIFALVLAGCSSDWMLARERSEQANTTPPISYRDDILAFMRTYLNDPTGVRDAFVSEPALRTLDSVSRYTVCLRYNARTSNGKYAGSKDSLVLFRDGRLDRIVDNARGRCKDAAYQPFFALERISR
jgi:hypothetical protein